MTRYPGLGHTQVGCDVCYALRSPARGQVFEKLLEPLLSIVIRRLSGDHAECANAEQPVALQDPI